MRHKLLPLAIIILLPCLVRSQSLKPIPWNGHKAALSFTFDDGLPVHLDVAVPELDKRGLRGSFFLIVDTLTRMPEWQAAQKEGHELGNHSVTHQQSQFLSPAQAIIEVDHAQDFLQDNFGKPMLDFSYPEGFYTQPLYSEVAKKTFIARSVSGNPASPSDELLYVGASGPLDWFDVSSHEGGAKCDGNPAPCPVETYTGWIDTTINKQSWTGILFHGIGDDTGYNPVSVPVFDSVLDYAKSKSDLWVAPFVEVGGYLKATEIMSRVVAITRPASPSEVQAGQIKDNWAFYWNTPSIYPKGVTVKVMITFPDGYNRVSQEGKEVLTNKDGSYTISMDSKVLMLNPAL